MPATSNGATNGHDARVWRRIRDVVGTASESPDVLDASFAIDWDALITMDRAVGGTATATTHREAAVLDSPRHLALSHAIARASPSPTKMRRAPSKAVSRVWNATTRGTAARTRKVDNIPAIEAEPTSPSATRSDDDAVKRSNAAVATKPMRKKRVRRKVEVARLRVETEALETTLLELREHWKQQSSSAIVGSPYAKSRRNEYGPRWRSMAAHEKELLREAVQANDELRAEYQWQKKMARDLRKILMKRVAIASNFDYVFYNMQAPNAGQLVANGAFDRLVHDLGPMSDELGRIQGILKDRERSDGDHTFREWGILEDAEAHGGLLLELVDSYALPFGFALVNDSIRRQFGDDNKDRTDKSFSEYFNHTGDVTVHQSIVRYNNSKGRGNVRLREVVRNICISATHSVFLSMKLIEPATDAGKPIHAVTIREKKWTVIRGSSSRSDPDEGDMTFVQSYHTMTPEVIYEGFEGRWNRKMIESEMIPAWNMSLGTVHRRLESDLIEQSKRSNPRSLPPSNVQSAAFDQRSPICVFACCVLMSSLPDSCGSVAPSSTDDGGGHSGSGQSVGHSENPAHTLDDVLERIFEEWSVETDAVRAAAARTPSTATPAPTHAPDACAAPRRLTPYQPPLLECASRVQASDQQVLGKKKVSQINRRAVIKELRDEEKRLESKLQDLREVWKRESTAQLYRIHGPWSDTSGSISRSTEVWVEPLWKQIAAREEQRLRISQQRNLVLKAQAQQQLQADKRLRKKFLRRIVNFKVGFYCYYYLLLSAVLLSSSHFVSSFGCKANQQRLGWLGIMDWPRNDYRKALLNRRNYFEMLLDDTGSMLEDMSRIQKLLDRRELADNTSAFREWQVQKDSVHGLFLECIDCCTLPYKRSQVVTAIRRLHGETRQLHSFNHCCEYFDSSDDFIAYQSLVRYTNAHGEGHVRMREIVRDFSDDTHTVYLVVTVIEPATAAGKALDAISVRWRKWIIVSTQDTQGTVESGCATSLMQSYQMITPEVIHRNYEPFWNANLLHGMIQIWDASLSVIQRRLESHLMEQGMRSSQGIEASALA